MSTTFAKTSHATSVLSVQPAAPAASTAMLIFSIMLVVSAFVYPFGDAWRTPLTYNDPFGSEHLETGAREGSLQRQIGIGSLGLFGIALAAWPAEKRIRIRGALGALCLAYLGWCMLSVLWSDEVYMSFRRWAAFMCEVVAAIAIARHLSARQFVYLVLTCTTAWLAWGFLAETLQGLFRPWEEGHRFAGVFHPNVTGVNCAILTLAAIYLARTSDRHRWALLALAIIGFVFLFLTRSRTSVLALLVSLAAWWLFTTPISRKVGYGFIGAAFGTLLAIAAGMGAFSLSTDMVTMGREGEEMSTLTGRVPLWQELICDYAPQRPIFGSGYGAFWSAERIANVSRSQGWAISHAHSSYIDLVLNLGYVGAILCILVMGLATWTAFRREATFAGAGYGFIAMLVLFGLTSSINETYIGLTWFLSLFGVCGICFLLFDDLPNGSPAIVEANLPQPNLYWRPRPSKRSRGLIPTAN